MIRKAVAADIPEILSLARVVAKDLHNRGIDQWSDTYPNKDHFLNDMKLGGLFVYCQDNTIIGSISVLPENDIFYKALVWRTNKAYVVHRLMISPSFRRKHIGTELFAFALDHARKCEADGVKVDTHPDNFGMQGLILSLGFTEIGYIKDMNRIGYELVF